MHKDDSASASASAHAPVLLAVPAFAATARKNNSTSNRNIRSTRNSTIERTAKSCGIQSAAQALHAP